MANRQPILALARLKNGTPGLTVAVIDEQLNWHREWVDRASKEEKEIPAEKNLPNRKSKLRELRSAVRRYKASPVLRARA